MKIDNHDIFEQIGSLFYSIAADQQVKPIEVGELKAMISKDWLPGKLSESLVSDETHCILMAMDFLEGSKATAKDAFEEFAKFFSLHPEAFTKELKQKVLNTAVEITTLFRADNPFRNPHLVAVKNLLSLDDVKV
jgi:hypothetical protein